MEKILDASGYHFHVLTIDGHKYWIGNELAHAFDYSKAGNMLQTVDKEDVHTIVLTKENGLVEIKKILKEVSLLNKTTFWNKNSTYIAHMILVREDTLQKYLTLYTRKPDAKEIGKKLYEILSSGHPVFNEEVLDDWGTSIDELSLTAPQLADVSKKINGFIFGLVGNRELANESKSWLSFLLSLAIKTIQIHFSTERRF